MDRHYPKRKRTDAELKAVMTSEIKRIKHAEQQIKYYQRIIDSHQDAMLYLLNQEASDFCSTCGSSETGYNAGRCCNDKHP